MKRKTLRFNGLRGGLILILGLPAVGFAGSSFCPQGFSNSQSERQLSQSFAQAYVYNGQDADALMSCLPANQSVTASQLVQGSAYPIYLASLQRLRELKTPRTRKFIEAYDVKYDSNSLPILKMSPFDQTLHALNLPAGVNRGDGQIRFSLSEIPARFWMVTFTHELQHVLDPLLDEAIMNFNAPETVKRLTYYAKAGYRIDQLAPVDRDDLFKWIEAGLSRGLWAEFRAWAGTYVLYREMSQHGIVPRNELLESMTAGARNQTQAVRQIYDFLSPRFAAPDGGPFQLALFQEAYRMTLEKYAVGPVPTTAFSWMK